MFPTSTQRKHWTFTGETQITQNKMDANQKYVNKYGGNNLDEDAREKKFLTFSEEKIIGRHFEHVLREFCNVFQPPMPKYVTGTALCYFKRFYVKHSVMDYHPKDIMLTCVYLACKVEEFNVSITQFVGNLKGDREKFTNTILTFELQLMKKLHYHLTIHNPYRPMEGLFIDIKTRGKSIDSSKVEKLRKAAEDFLERSLATNVSLIFAPSQIALAAILTSAESDKISLDSYLADMLLAGCSSEEVKKTVYQIKRIKYMVSSQEPLQKDQIGSIQRKLEQCRNQENNPDSDIYKRKLQEMLDDEDEIQTQKRIRFEEEEKRAEQELVLGLE